MAAKGKGLSSIARNVESIRRDKISMFGRLGRGGFTNKCNDTYSVMFGEWRYISRHGSLISGGGMEKIGESIYVEVADKLVVSKAKVVWPKDAGGCRSGTTYQLLQLHSQWFVEN